MRDIVDDLFIQVNGSFVAGYKVSGINSYYASDEERNRTKSALEALVRSLPERSMRMQARFEISEGAGDLIGRYNREQRNPSPVLQAARPTSSRMSGRKRTPMVSTCAIFCTSISIGTRGSITSLPSSSGRRRCAAAVSACRRLNASNEAVASTKT